MTVLVLGASRRRRLLHGPARAARRCARDRADVARGEPAGAARARPTTRSSRPATTSSSSSATTACRASTSCSTRSAARTASRRRGRSAAAGRCSCSAPAPGPTFSISSADFYRKMARDRRLRRARLEHGRAVVEVGAACSTCSPAGELEPVATTELPLEDVNEAHARIVERRAGGKLLLVSRRACRRTAGRWARAASGAAARRHQRTGDRPGPGPGTTVATTMNAGASPRPRGGAEHQRDRQRPSARASAARRGRQEGVSRQGGSRTRRRVQPARNGARDDRAMHGGRRVPSPWLRRPSGRLEQHDRDDVDERRPARGPV